jgi:hypothetical protein
MRLLVTGGRDYRNALIIFSTLDKLHKWYGLTAIIHGAANIERDHHLNRSADLLAGLWARVHDVEEIACPANWKMFGKAAGPMRNGKMIKMEPDAVLQFPGGVGTADCVRQALAAGLEVIEVEEPVIV